MTAALLPSLPENAGLAFLGETVRPDFLVAAAVARSLLAAANPHGKPNADVLHEFIPTADSRPLRPRWLIDFPAGMSADEAALYQRPFRLLLRRPALRARRVWQNPGADVVLRSALAKLERYLVTPAAAPSPAWTWIDSQYLPGHRLLVVARDDDFIDGVLVSRFFQAWWRHHHPRHTGLAIVRAFPFPWPPATRLSALTRQLEDRRLDVARAARSGAGERLDAAVASAYGLVPDLPDEELVSRLREWGAARRPVVGKSPGR